MGEWGYFKKAYPREVDEHGRSYIVKEKANMTPTVITAYSGERGRAGGLSVCSTRTKTGPDNPNDHAC